MKHKILDLSTELIRGKLATLKRLKADLLSISPLSERFALANLPYRLS